jgi:DNA-binding GntR family transcriptional regulator
MTGVPPEPSKADLVYRRLKGEIETGALLPGAPLAELGLVARTGASRTPVREALRRLAADGLVDLVPRQGARVSTVSPRSVRDLFDFRALLEPAAMRQATTAAAGDPTLRRTLTRMRADFDKLRRRRPSPARSRAFYDLADRFDWLVIDATANEHLRRAVGELRPHTARLRNLSHTDPDRIEVSVVEHLRMVDAVLAGDADEAAAACADHLAAGVRTIFATLAAGADADLDLLAQ